MTGIAIAPRLFTRERMYHWLWNTYGGFHSNPFQAWATATLLIFVAAVAREFIPLPYPAMPYATYAVAAAIAALFLGPVQACFVVAAGLSIAWTYYFAPSEDLSLGGMVRTTMFVLQTGINIVSISVTWGCIQFFLKERKTLALKDHNITVLLNEVTHRVKNQYAVIAAMARQTHAEDIEAFKDEFAQRIHGLSTTHDLLVASDFQDTKLRCLVTAQLKPFVSLSSKVIIEGPDVLLNAAGVQYLGMAFHELAVNSSKYGALRHDHLVEISWRLSDKHLIITWRGLVSVPLPTRRGFGTMVLTQFAPAALDGHATYSVGPNGVEWCLTIPRDKVRVA